MKQSYSCFSIYQVIFSISQSIARLSSNIFFCRTLMKQLWVRNETKKSRQSESTCVVHFLSFFSVSFCPLRAWKTTPCLSLSLSLLLSLDFQSNETVPPWQQRWGKLFSRTFTVWVRSGFTYRVRMALEKSRRYQFILTGTNQICEFHFSV